MNLIRLGEIRPNDPQQAVGSLWPSSRAAVPRRAGSASKTREACTVGPKLAQITGKEGWAWGAQE